MNAVSKTSHAMTWTTTDATHTTTAAGLEFILEPTDWSIWSLDQARATACHIANLKACGLNPWAPGATVRLFYRAGQAVNGRTK